MPRSRCGIDCAHNRVLLINPPWNLSKKARLLRVHSISPPLGLAYMAAVLESNNIEVKILDAAIEDLTLSEIIQRVEQYAPTMAGVTATTPLIFAAAQIIQAIKQHLPSTVTLLGGVHVSALPEETMKTYPEIDIGVLGEGELKLLDLAKGKTPRETEGITYHYNDRIILTKSRELIRDLDTLPLPARHLLPDLQRYRLAPSNFSRTPVTTMITSRGCPFGCIYCNKQVYGNTYRSTSPQKVISEMKELAFRYRMREVKIWDDTFTLNQDRVKQICKMMQEERVDLTWSCETRVDLVSPELLAEMHNAGCWLIDFGIESGNQEILNKIGKGVSLQQIRRAIQMTREVGIKTRGYFMIGLPGDTPETIAQTIDFSKSLDLDHATFFITTPFPATRLYDLAEREGEGTIFTKDWSEYYSLNEGRVLFVPKSMTERELRDSLTKAYNEFYFRPSYIWKTVSRIRNIDDLRRTWRGASSLIYSN